MNYQELARQVIEAEISELQRLTQRIDESFGKVIEELRLCVEQRRKIVVCGVGKSGNIGRKLVATLNSTGATSVNLNAQDALHGDLGVLDEGDVVILLSYRGETQELLELLPYLRRVSVTLVAITGNLQSSLAKNSDYILDVSVQREACPLNLAPTSSTTVMLVLCDALAMVLLEARGFKSEDFARFHPSGSLGRALLTRVRDVMRTGNSMAMVSPNLSVADSLKAMTESRSGAAIVVGASQELLGVFTHGDFVRAFQSDAAISHQPVENFMTFKPVTIHQDKLATEVLVIFQQKRVDEIVVIDDENRPVGLVDTQDLSRLKLV